MLPGLRNIKRRDSMRGSFEKDEVIVISVFRRDFQNIWYRPNKKISSVSTVDLPKGYHLLWKVYQRVTFCVQNGVY